MQCTRCGEELPGDTPICRKCGPASFGSSPWASSTPPTPMPVELRPLPSLATPAPAPLTALTPVAIPALPDPAEARPSATPPPIPTGAPRLTRREKKERARQRLAERGLLKPEPTFSARPADTAISPSPSARVTEHEPEVEDEAAPSVEFPVPQSIRLLAQVDLVMGLAALILAGLRMNGMGAAHAASIGGGAFETFTLLLFGVACLVAAAGLISLRPLGRRVQLALSGVAFVFGGFSIPAAILIGIYLVQPGVALLLSGRRPAKMTAAERQRVREGTGGSILIRIAAVVQMGMLVYRLFPLLSSL